jgi:hypothetical protein
MQRLAADDWRVRRAAHRERLAPFTAERVGRRFAHRKHPIADFLFEYYSFRPAQLLRWSPGVGMLLEGATREEIDWADDFTECNGSLVLDAATFPARRVKFLRWAVNYLEGIAARPALFGCFGLHEWAMVYRVPEVRHAATPLRLPPEQIAALVEVEGLRCTHFDAYRFFTPAAAPLNRVPLNRRDTEIHDQKGCVHVTMDVYRYAYKLAPWGSAELIADAFLLAREARTIDMRASPYDLSAFGLAPIPVETRPGRDEYAEVQRDLSRKAEPLRERLVAEYRCVLRQVAPS